MEAQHYNEMVQNCEELEQSGLLEHKRIFLFGHCSASEKLAGLLRKKGYAVAAILDNSREKQGKVYLEIPVVSPESVLSEPAENVIICIATRFYESMQAQLRQLGFTGDIRKLVDYNTYAEYSLSEETIERKRKRVEHGLLVVEGLERKYPGCFRVRIRRRHDPAGCIGRPGLPVYCLHGFPCGRASGGISEKRH